MIVVRWLWRLSVATALALLGPSITSAAVLAAPPEATQIYTYDSPQHPAGLADIAIERGPPASHARDIRYDAVDQWSHGDSVRPDSPVAGSTTTDAIPAEFAQDNSVTTGAGGHAAVVDGDFPSLHRARVAAKTVDDVLPGVKAGWPSRVADNGKGTVWQAPGSTGNANMLRVMAPTERYPNGYVRFYNEHRQPIGLNGKPGPRPDTHIQRNPDGTYDLPEGW